MLDGVLIVEEADGLGLIASDHFPEFTARVVIQKEQRRETLVDHLRLEVVAVKLLGHQLQSQIFDKLLLMSELSLDLSNLLIFNIDLPAHGLLVLKLLFV